MGRGSFALARLAGALTIALVTAVVLLGGTATFLQLRSGLPLEPALVGGLACTLGMVAMSSLAMWVSLYLGRVGTVLLVFSAVATVSVANGFGLAGSEPSGLLGAVDRFGPPLATSLALAVASWIPQLSLPASAWEVSARLLVWAGGGVALLCMGFARRELSD